MNLSDPTGAPAPRGPRLAFTRLACGLSALLALAALAGWSLDMPALRTVVPGAIAMKANTALGLLLCAGALWLLTLAPSRPSRPSRSLSAVMASATVALGLLTLCAHAFGWGPGLEQILLRDSDAALQQASARMTPYSAQAFVALGLAIVGLPQRRWQRWVRVAAVWVIATGTLAFVGYLWNLREIVTDPTPTSMALHTSWALTLLGLASLQMVNALHTPARSRERSRIETLVLRGFIPCGVFVLMGAGLIYTNSARFAETTRHIGRAQTMRAELASLYGALADAELARRNQMLTQHARFESAFQWWVQETQRGMKALTELHPHESSEGLALQQLSEKVELHLQTLQNMHIGIGISAQSDPKVVDGYRLLLEQSAGAMEDIGHRIQQLDRDEVQRLREGVQQAQAHRRTTLLALAATLAALAALFILLFRGIQKEVQARNRVQEQLQQLNTELEQRVAERTGELQRQQDFLRRVIDLNHNLIFAKDGAGRFLLANQAMADFYGTTVEALVGSHEHSFNPDTEQVRGFMAADQQVISGDREMAIAEEAVRNGQGETRWFSTLKRPLLSPDGSTILLGVATDITARKASADQLRQMTATLELRVAERTQALQQANAQLQASRHEADAASRSKSAFLANMSHEIRTPMNAIIGLTHLLSRDTRDRLQRERLNKVGAAAQHLLQLINNILDISKIEAGKLTLADSEFALDTLLQQAVAMVSDAAAAKGLELIVQADSLPPRLHGDPTRLSQILINLLSNAVKFTASGWVRLSGQVLQAHDDRLLLQFEVQDTGPGIPLAQQATLFNAFEQADSSASRLHGGTGLGLALSRQLAHAMGGEAGVHSAPGAGSRFWFTAWLGRMADAPSPAEPNAWQGLRALLVDTACAGRDALSQQLSTLGLQVDTADGGKSAVRQVEDGMAARQAYDLVLIGDRKPAPDGVDTLPSLRKVLGAGMPPCLQVTTDAAPQTAQDPHFDALLRLPLETPALQAELARWLQPSDSSAPGEGAAPHPTSHNAQLLRLRHTGQRILLAEDNPVNREVAQDLLELVGLTVETAWNGARAVEMAASRQYDLILMDMQMPMLDGLEATRAIRQSSGLSLVIVAMTANAFEEERRACLDAGMNDHLAKPVSPELLYAKLLRWLPLRPPASSELMALVEHHAHSAARGEPLSERLAGIPGFDVDTALANVAGQISILERVLVRFVEAYAQGLPELLNTRGPTREVLARWATVCHSVRGALTAVGAPELIEQLRRFEEQLHHSETPEALSAQAEQLHDQLLRLVEHLAREIST